MNKKTKVCYVVTKGNWGGAQKYVYNLATNLPKEYFDVVVVIGDGNILEEKLSKAGIRTIKVENLKRDIKITNELKSFVELFKLIKNEAPDILHLNSPKAAGFGGVIGRILFIKKIIQTVHGWTFNEERNIWSTTLITFFSWITIILCHKTIVIGEHEKNQAEIMPFVIDSKIVLIRNGVEKISYLEKNAARRDLLARVGLELERGTSTLFLGTISELHKNKGIEYALAAVSKLNFPFYFFIIGEGEEWQKILSLIQRYGLEKKVFLLGFIEKASDYLKAFDVFLLTSIKEGLPYVVLEAGLAGLPVIASNVGGIPDIIENSVSGILTTKARSGEITRAIEYLLNNPDKQKLFATNIKQKILKEFSLKQMLEKTLELYN